jgi:four helix bundle protein
VLALMMLGRVGVAGFSRYEDIVAWQLADELKREVFARTATGPPARDFKFRDQIRDSSASAARNIAEGFGRFRVAEFARFLEFARGSPTETHNSLRDGRDRGYFSDTDCDRLSRLAGRAAKATSALIRYLRSSRNQPSRTP